MEFHQRTIIIVHGQFLLVIAEQFATMYQVGVKTQLQMKCSGGGEREERGSSDEDILFAGQVKWF